MVGATRDILEAGEVKGGKGGDNSGTRGSTCRGDEDTRIGNGNGGGGVTGGQWLQRGRMERGGGLRPLTQRTEIQLSNHRRTLKPIKGQSLEVTLANALG